jgi:hypothetical protein
MHTRNQMLHNHPFGVKTRKREEGMFGCLVQGLTPLAIDNHPFGVKPNTLTPDP